MSRTLRLELLLSVALLSGMAMGATAQTAGSSPWWVEAQAGFSNASGEGSFFGMTSPALAVSAGYRFSRPLAPPSRVMRNLLILTHLRIHGCTPRCTRQSASRCESATC